MDIEPWFGRRFVGAVWRISALTVEPHLTGSANLSAGDGCADHCGYRKHSAHSGKKDSNGSRCWAHFTALHVSTGIGRRTRRRWARGRRSAAPFRRASHGPGINGRLVDRQPVGFPACRWPLRRWWVPTTIDHNCRVASLRPRVGDRHIYAADNRDRRCEQCEPARESRGIGSLHLSSRP